MGIEHGMAGAIAAGASGALDPERRGVARRYLAERSWLWDVHHLAARATAMAAFRRAQGSARGAQPRLTRDVLDRAASSLADRTLQFNIEALAFRECAARFGFTGAGAVAACRAFNRAPGAARRAFLGVVVEQRPLDAVAVELEWDASRTAREVRVLLERFLQDLLTPRATPNVLGVFAPQPPRPSPGTSS